MRSLILAAALACAPLTLTAESYPEAHSIITIGGPVTETVFALGEGDRVVARDTTSLYPEEVNALPDVGYMRQLSAEGVLSLGPDLIITRDTAGPPEVLDQLRTASVPMVEVKDAFTAESVSQAVRTIGDALAVKDKTDALVASIEAEFAALAARVDTGPKPRAMFILSNQGGRLNVSGGGTGANGVFELAGAENVFTSEFDGYKIASDEAIIAAAPDVIVMLAPTGEDEHDVRREDTLALHAIAQTPAGQNEAFVLVDPAALGFGPRTAQLVSHLRDDLVAAVGN
ncbi:heme/hemin ABC transporter substrate-binding protein [Celeribacter sp.]|uniref:heme/hemin ABC transporter substrate-binding protein n=1 Tax=Celeribacter sp. TaxID=1890673 RepID=UPI003A8DAE1E